MEEQEEDKLGRVKAYQAGDVSWQVGKLGGHIGRKSDGYPGILTISKGLYQRYATSIIYKLLTYG